MIKPLNRQKNLLSQRATPATRHDVGIGQDLADTLKAHRQSCVGMAANMIGINKAIIAVSLGPIDVTMYNPRIIRRASPYQTKEGCLVLDGQRTCRRYRKNTVSYLDEQMKKHRVDLEGMAAEIVQHEVDHLHGIMI